MKRKQRNLTRNNLQSFKTAITVPEGSVIDINEGLAGWNFFSIQHQVTGIHAVKIVAVFRLLVLV